MIEIVRLVFAGLATILFLVATFVKIHPDMDRHDSDLARSGRWTAAGTFCAAVVFSCEVLSYFFPTA
ncbi:hypothetical protein ACI3KW_17395 [Devosia sp. ZW T5_3]|uniref:hypothetical protein n=1 Tax=Devosia sp. ZW T5_3 TaxID=3378085 RepID=UPI003853350B